MTTLVKEKSANAIQLIKSDHQKVKKLFKEFEDSDHLKEKKQIVQKAIEELKIHATLEEEIFYPALRREAKEAGEILEEADEEHHVAKVLIAELEMMSGDEDNFEAKFIVLAENIRHHIKEEEDEMLPEARKTDIDFNALGEKMLLRKQELLSGELPRDAESDMVQQSGLRGESPSKKAQAHIEIPKKKR